MNGSPGEVGIAVALALALVEVSKSAVAALANKMNGDSAKTVALKSALREDERRKLLQLYDWHAKQDEDGRPVWYSPRGWGRKLDDLVDQSRKAAEQRNESARLLREIRDGIKKNGASK